MSNITLDTVSRIPLKRGHRADHTSSSTTGRRIGARLAPSGRLNASLDFGRTLNAALLRQSKTRPEGQNLSLQKNDLHIQVRSQEPRRLVIFLIDTSDSMGDGPTARISAALGASMTLAARSYLNRDQVCLITFRDREAQLVVPPTNSVSRLKQQLPKLPVGGATPLAAGLHKVHNVIRQARAKSPQTKPLLVLLSDGEATSSIAEGADPQAEALAQAEQLSRAEIPAIVIDSRIENRRHSFMSRLAQALGTQCHHIQDLQAGKIVNLIETDEAIKS